MGTKDILFACAHCEAQYTKWVGRCLECGKWGTVKESSETPSAKIIEKKYASVGITRLADVQGTVERITTGIMELDRVLGGGIVPGSLILLGGEPGIGKSTLSLQLALALPNVLYVSGEESVEQIKLRATRLRDRHEDLSLQLINELRLEQILGTMQEQKSQIVIVDSIQTIYSEQVEGGPGSVSQVRACAAQLLQAAKSWNVAIVLVGHVTKDGVMAGPRTLEHLVDTVVYLEGDRFHTLRLLRAVKNRFGSTDEIGMFSMTESGLVQVENPSALLLEERGDGMSGSVVTCLMEGSRPLLVEVQALVHRTSFGYPVRKASGFDLNRLHVLLAVLQKRVGLEMGQYDVHVNVVGGVKAHEPAADLAVCLAVASAFKDTVLGNDLAAFGEVGLGGEVRSVRLYDRRVKECEQLGMKRILTSHHHTKKAATKGNIRVVGVKHIEELIKHV